MSFLEEARKRRARDEMPAEQQAELDNADGGMPELLFTCEDELIAVVEAATAVVKLHARYGLYPECEHDVAEDEPEHHGGKAPVCIEDIGNTCADPQWVCYECHTDDGDPNENSEYGEYPCATIRGVQVALDALDQKADG